MRGPRWRSLALELLAPAILACIYVPRVVTAALGNTDAGRGDQSSYLRLALKIANGDGFANGNYHPLYSLILQPWATHDWGFFTHAKLVSAGLGAMAVFTVFTLGRRLVGAFPAFVAAALLARNAEFVGRAARTEPEALVTGLLFAAWASWTVGWALLIAPKPPAGGAAFWGHWLAAPATGDDDRTARAHRWLLAAGLLGGFTYLAKGTGQFLLIGYGVFGLAFALRRSRLGAGWAAWKPLVLLAGGYLIAASPLLATNWRAFGSPFYAFPSAHAMWYDSWEDRYGSGDGRHITMATYLASHTPAQVLERLGNGLLELDGEWVDAVEVLGTHPLVSLLLLSLFAAVLWRYPTPLPELDRALVKTLLLTGGWLFLMAEVFFGWYREVVSSSRFLLPFAPMVLLGAAWCLSLLPTVRKDVRQHPPTLPLGLIAMLCAAVFLMTDGGASLAVLNRERIPSPTTIAASDREHNNATIAALEALKANVPADGTYVWGPGDLGTWPLYGLMSSESIPSTVTDWPGLEAFFRREEATHILLAPDMVAKRATVLGRSFQATEETVDFSAIPPGWRLVAGYPAAASGCRYCLFELPAIRPNLEAPP